MKTSGMRWVGLLAIAGLWSCTANAPDLKPGGAETTASVGLLSAYTWRGQVINDEAVLQPELCMQKNGLGIRAWANYDLTDSAVDDSPQCTEVDLAVFYTHHAGPVELTGSYTEYLFPHQTLETGTNTATGAEGESTAGGVAYPGTREIQLDASLPDRAVVPTLSVVRDIDEAGGCYFSAALGYTAELRKDQE